MYPTTRPVRRGSVLPLLVISLTALFGFVALAIDLGMIALARTQCQNAADCAALAGARTLSGDPANSYNFANCEPAARRAVSANQVLGAYLNGLDTSVAAVQVGSYSYDATTGVWTPRIPKPSGDPYSLVRVTVSANNRRTFFGGALGVTAFNTGAMATAAHRPRDVALVLDFSGSMRFASCVGIPYSGVRDNGSGTGSGSNNPESVYPQFGHYSSTTAGLRFTSNATIGGNQYAPANITAADPANGTRPPIVGDFYQHPPYTDPDIPAFNNTVDASGPNIPADASLDADKLAGGDAPLREGHLLNLGNLFGAPYAKTLADVFGLTIAVDRPLFLTNGYDYPALGRPSFSGYTRGPRYWGKTFFIWPPDPRPAHDWRKKFFENGDGTPLVDHRRLWDANGNWLTPSSTRYRIKYSAILNWIKNTGANPFPPRLHSGHINYYTAIPDSIDTSSFPPANRDQRFWKEYIDSCLGLQQTGSNSWSVNISDVGYGDDFAWGTPSINNTVDTPTTSASYRLNNGDNPKRPRTRFWFGPMTMVDFIGNWNDDRWWWPGDCHEAPLYACKLGIQGAITDVQNNHPNDVLSLITFSFPKNSFTDTTSMAGPGRFNAVRVPLGRNYNLMTRSLWFPPATLNADGSNNGTMITPYDAANVDVPRAAGATCYSMGLMLAYNQFQYTATTDTVLRKWITPSTSVPEGMAGGMGRKGAQKMIIFVTDGLPNVSANANVTTSGTVKYYPIRYNAASPASSQYPTVTYFGDNHSSVTSQIYTVINQIKADYSTPRKSFRLHTLGFGPVFDTGSPNRAAGLSTLQTMQFHGNTQSIATTPLDAYKIITGDDAAVMSKLQTAMTQIMQGSIQIVLIE